MVGKTVQKQRNKLGADINNAVGVLIQRLAWERYCKDTDLNVEQADNFWGELNRGVQMMYIEKVLVEDFGMVIGKKRYRNG